MGKTYSEEKPGNQKEQLSVISRFESIINSSYDIQIILDGLVDEIKKLIDVNWAAIALIIDGDLHFVALSPEMEPMDSAWGVGEGVPIKGTAAEAVFTNNKTVVESDLSRESSFMPPEHSAQHGIRSIAYFPLTVFGEAIGSLILASRHANTYNNRVTKIFEQLASMVAMQVRESRLDIKTQKRVRIRWAYRIG